MIARQRILFSDNGTFTDYSKQAANLFADEVIIPATTGEDYLYIGSDLPFNHRYFKVESANDALTTVSVEVWDGNGWTAAVDVIDQTSAAGVSLAGSGIISWSLSRNGFFSQVEDTTDVAALTSLKIYDMYWARLSWDDTLEASTSLKYIGFKFSDDSELGAYYPDLLNTSLMDAYEQGKTTWETQHILAAEECINHLKSRKMIWSPSQILNWEQFRLPAIHNVAKIIYSAFGDDYDDQRKLSQTEFHKAMNLGIVELDRNEDGRRDEQEKRKRSTNWVRS